MNSDHPVFPWTDRCERRYHHCHRRAAKHACRFRRLRDVSSPQPTSAWPPVFVSVLLWWRLSSRLSCCQLHFSTLLLPLFLVSPAVFSLFVLTILGTHLCNLCDDTRWFAHVLRDRPDDSHGKGGLLQVEGPVADALWFQGFKVALLTLCLFCGGKQKKVTKITICGQRHQQEQWQAP